MKMRFGFFFGRYLHFFPVITLPLFLAIIPLVRGEALFWGLPATQFVPWRALALQQWFAGEWPLWNPLNGMGAPLLANYQSALFYPPGWIQNLFYGIGGTPLMAWSALLVNALHLAFAGAGMMCFLRAMGVRQYGQTVGGLAFAMSGFFVARIGTSSMIWAGAWLPWVMLGGLRAVNQQNSSNRVSLTLPLTLSVAMQLLAGHAQTTWYTLMVLVPWMLVLAWKFLPLKRLMNLVMSLALSMTMAVGIAAVQLLPTAEYLFQSQRADAIDYEMGLAYSFWPWRLLSFLSPDFFGNPGQGTYFGYASYWEDAVYIGLIPFILALSTLPRLVKQLRKKDNPGSPPKVTAFFWIVILIGTILALGKNLPIFPFLYQNLPTFDMFNAPARFMLLVVFSLAVLTGFGADEWRKPSGKALRRLKQITVAMAAVTLGAFVTWIALSEVRVTFISATATAGLLASGYCFFTLKKPSEITRLQKWQRYVIGFICLDLIFNTRMLIPTTEKSLYSTSQYQSQLSRAEGERIYLSAGDEYALKFSRFFRFEDFRPIEDWLNLRAVPLPDLNILDNAAMVNNFDPLQPERYARVMKEIETLDDRLKTSWLKWMNVGLVVEENLSAENGLKRQQILPWGRFRWVPCAEVALNGNEALQKTKNNLAQATVDDGVLTVVVLENASANLHDCEFNQNATIRTVNITSQHIKLQTQTSQAGYLVIADVYYPGWEATINGARVEIMKGDYLFSAVELPPGQNDIDIVYRPRMFYTGLAISGIAILFVILLVIIYTQNNLGKTTEHPGD